MYGALGTLLTGERWWLGVMALLGVLRLFSSAVGINPRALSATNKSGPHTTGTTAQNAGSLDTAALPTIAPGTLADPDYSMFQRETSPSKRPLSEIKGFVLDMDGVLYHVERVRAGAVAFIRS